MSPITKIAWRRICKQGKRSFVALISTLVSHLLISFFVGFTLQLLGLSIGKDLPASTFFVSLSYGMVMIALILLLLTLISVRIRCRGRREENQQTLSVLTSIGALPRHKLHLSTLEFFLLYVPPILLGSIVGCYPGMASANVLSSGSDVSLPLALLCSMAIGLVGLLLTAICFFIPPIRLEKASLIGSIRRQESSAAIKHGYRNSRTFREKSLLKRLAKKSVDYYAGTYGGIALGFFLALMYPVLILILIYILGNKEIVLDINPGDGVDTTGTVMSAVNRMLYFLAAAFAALTATGFVQALLMARDQILRRRESAKVYRAVGMTEKDIGRLIGCELRSVGLRVFIYLVVGVIIVVTLLRAAIGM